MRKRCLSLILILIMICTFATGCTQVVNYNVDVSGKIESVENNLVTIRAVREQTVDIFSSSITARDPKYWYLPEDEYFKVGKDYNWYCYYENESTLEYELSTEWLNENNTGEFLESAEGKVCEFSVSNGKITDIDITTIPVAYERDYPAGILGEAFPGEIMGYNNNASGGLRGVNWLFIEGSGIVLYAYGLTEENYYVNLEIVGITECRVYWLESTEENVENIWIDTPDEDLLVKITNESSGRMVFSAPGGFYLDENGSLQYEKSEITESSYEIMDFTVYTKEMTITVLN